MSEGQFSNSRKTHKEKLKNQTIKEKIMYPKFWDITVDACTNLEDGDSWLGEEHMHPRIFTTAEIVNFLATALADGAMFRPEGAPAAPLDFSKHYSWNH